MARLMMTDALWSRLAPLLPDTAGRRGRPRPNDRVMIEAILWVLRTGSPWRDLPPELGPWQSAYSRLARWQRAGIWDALWAHLKNRCRSRVVQPGFDLCACASTRGGESRRARG